MRYIVARVINSPRGSVRTARLLITDVPDKTKVDDVMTALEEAGKAAELSEAGVPFGNHEIKSDGRGWPYGISGIEEATRITWAELTKTPVRNEGKRATLRFTDGEFSRIRLAAQRRGQSLQAFALEALLAAAEAAEQSADAAPPAKITKTTKKPSQPALGEEAAAS